MPVLSITAATVTSSLGAGLSAHEAALLAAVSYTHLTLPTKA